MREIATTLVQSRSGLALAPEPELPPLGVTVGDEATPGDLRVLSPLGEGGSGNVFLARQRSLDRLVAIKMLRDDSRDAGQGLVAEARVAARVEHPNVVPIYQLGATSPRSPVLVMKNIRGVSWLELANDPRHALWERLAPHGRERLLVHLEILLAVCNAVDAAHREGVLHRDVKPSNVMIAGPGEVYLMDWGIAVDRHAPSQSPRRGAIVGTPAYMSPERLSGDVADLDERSDVFMLGASLHFILTGAFRNPGATHEEAFAALRRVAPYAYEHGVPEELAAICTRATAARREDRFPSAAALREAVQSFIDHHTAFEMLERARDLIDRVEALPRADASAPQAAELARLELHGALSAWPESALARAQLERLRRLQVGIELARKHGQAARAVLQTLESPEPALVAGVEALEAEERARREREDRDAALVRDLDLRTAARTRRWFFGLLIVYALGLGVVFVILRARSGEDHTGLRHVGFSLASTTLFLIMFAVARREVMVNRVNRVIMGIVGATFLFNLLHRVVAYAYGGSPRLTLTIDTLVMGVTMGIGALMISPRLWVVPAVCLVGVVVSTVAPATSAMVFGLCGFVLFWRVSREWGRELDPPR
ncbi:MAG: serine/threonine protein kinase [Deltaproteobacteria bacterium]|nr:serine/threonine protein kinase [Deltaproteobacteria bacterium]